MTRKLYDGIIAYSAAVRHGSRERVMAHALATLTAGVPATRAWMWSVDRRGHRDAGAVVLLARGRQPRVPEQAGREYLEHYWIDDPFAPHRFTDRRRRVVSVGDVGGSEALRRTTYGREFLPTSGFSDRVCVHVWHDGRLVSVAALLRTPDEPPFGDHDVAFLHRVQPLVAQAYAQADDAQQGLEELSRMATLTQRQAEVAGLALRGLSNAEIARTLDISPETVKRHLSTVYARVGVRSRTELSVRVARMP